MQKDRDSGVHDLIFTFSEENVCVELIARMLRFAGLLGCLSGFRAILSGCWGLNGFRATLTSYWDV